MNTIATNDPLVRYFKAGEAMPEISDEEAAEIEKSIMYSTMRIGVEYPIELHVFNGGTMTLSREQAHALAAELTRENQSESSELESASLVRYLSSDGTLTSTPSTESP